ncbi:hypothetical protein KDA11_06870 [Candidatus Saccharibacteria bacterium]|nr:hypothetical protein [Candidatus Saccharibacteria bacterium]
MNLLRTSKIDLPVFPKETPITYPYEIPQLPEDRTSFLRSVVLGPGAHEIGLQKTLQIADNSFDKLVRHKRMQRIGACVIPHTWGLIEVSDEQIKSDSRIERQQGIVPQGYALVAEIPRVEYDMSSGYQPVAKNFEHCNIIEKVIKETNAQHNTGHSKLVVSDLGLRQFMYGKITNPNSDSRVDNSRSRPILVDIEPRIIRTIK